MGELWEDEGPTWAASSTNALEALSDGPDAAVQTVAWTDKTGRTC